MRSPFFKINTPPCPECGSQNTITGRKLKLSAGLGIAIGGSLLCYLLGYLYPLGRVLIPFFFFAGVIICFVPSLGRYCCLDCDAYWNPEAPHKIWRPQPPGL